MLQVYLTMVVFWNELEIERTHLGKILLCCHIFPLKKTFGFLIFLKYSNFVFRVCFLPLRTPKSYMIFSLFFKKNNINFLFYWCFRRFLRHLGVSTSWLLGFRKQAKMLGWWWRLRSMQSSGCYFKSLGKRLQKSWALAYIDIKSDINKISLLFAILQWLVKSMTGWKRRNPCIYSQ